MRRVYNTESISKLYQSIESHLTKEEQATVKEIIETFNALIKCAIKQKKTIDRRESQWLKESKENDKLKMYVEDLKESIELRNTVIKGMRNDIKELKKEIAENNKRKTR